MRYLGPIVEELSQEKYVLLAGPRQVGKTTLCKAWLKDKSGLYLNWDIDADRVRILKRDFLTNLKSQSFVFDEIHKYDRWKNWLKGLHDQWGADLRVVVTGSARLETFHRSGDSLLGRYELLRLHPFSIGELTHGKLVPPPTDWLNLETSKIAQDLWAQLKKRSGFPEPFTRDSDLQQTRWRRLRKSNLVHDELRDLTQIKLLSLVEHLTLLLPERVGSPLSLNRLKEILSVSHESITTWIDALDRLFYCFRISPFHARVTRSLRKEQKLYLWDWTEVEDEGPRFENVVASHLLKSCHAWTDVGYGEYALHYFRDREHREVDFVITSKRKPVAFFEVKSNDTALSANLRYLHQRYPDVACIQLVDLPEFDERRGMFRVVSAMKYLSALV